MIGTLSNIAAIDSINRIRDRLRDEDFTVTHYRISEDSYGQSERIDIRFDHDEKTKISFDITEVGERTNDQ